jgi:uncharacterized protein
VRQVLVGPQWAVVCSRACGLAAALGGDDPGRRLAHPERLSARALAEFARSDDLYEASLGMAAINSLIEVEQSLLAELNAFDALAELGRNRTVALVGHFPFVDRLRPRVGRLWGLEQQPQPGVYPAEAAGTLIPQADVLAITGSALTNHTIDGLLELASPQARVLVIGPSAPLSPAWFERGVDLVCSARVADEAALLGSLPHALNFRGLQGVRLASLANPTAPRPAPSAGPAHP